MRRFRRRPLGIGYNSSYNTSYNDDTSSNKSNFLTITRKGKETKIDMSVLEDLVKYLSNYSDHKLRDLKGESRDKYNSFLRFVEAFHGHEYHSELLSIINKHYRPRNKVMPHTIGSFLVGCTEKTDAHNQACSPLCAGNIKYNDNGDDFCSYPVIDAEWNKSSHAFNFLSSIEDDYQSKVAIVYVPFSSKNSFPGFNAQEKTWFKSKGLEEIRMFGTSDYRKYIPLYIPELENCGIKIDKIKSRAGIINTEIPLSFDSHKIFGFAIIVIVFLLILGFIYFRQRRH